MSAPGFVYLVGAGPWDPGLLTVRGRALLERAEVVISDYLVNPALLELAPAEALRLPLGRPPARPDQAGINALLVEHGGAGRVVVRLKGGDPFVFGRGGEEAEALADAGIPFEIVPGVTAAVASAAFAGIPVTDRRYGSTLGLCTGHQRADGTPTDVDWSALARMSTAVIYMGRRRLPEVAQALMDAGRAPQTPVALVQWATRPSQRTVVSTLSECAAAAEAAALRPPLTVIVGEVVALRERIGWFEQTPLFGLSVVVTRSRAQQGALGGRLAELGAEVVPLPTIAFRAPLDRGPLDAALGRLDGYDWIIFTSANGVDHFLDAVGDAGRDARAFGQARIACIGPATARRLAARGLIADRVPAEYVAEALIEALIGEGMAGQRVLIPRALVAREVLPDALRAAGATVEVVPVYETVPPPVDVATRDRIAQGEVDLITFTASSTVTHFRARFDTEEWAAVTAGVRAACIGPITAQTAAAAGLDVALVAETYTIPGLVDALVEWRRDR